MIGAGGSLRSANYIDIAANQVTLAGSIGKVTGSQLPILSFTSSDPAARSWSAPARRMPAALWLDAATLGRLSVGLFEINLGNSRHTGPVSIKADLTASSSLVMENGGRIAVDARVDLTSNPDSRVFASLYGGADSKIQVSGTLAASKAITLDAGSGAVEISAGARVSSDQRNGQHRGRLDPGPERHGVGRRPAADHPAADHDAAPGADAGQLSRQRQARPAAPPSSPRKSRPARSPRTARTAAR
jgi:hypothetical protein